MAKFDPDYTAAYYDDYGECESAHWEAGPRSQMQYAIYCHHLQQRVNNGDNVLDAGCGPGTFTKILLNQNARVTCLDLSPVQLDRCRQFAPGADEYRLGSITDLGTFNNDTFDVSLALGCSISYCFDRATDAVNELVRVTRPDGQVGLSVMNLFGTFHLNFSDVLAVPTNENQNILATGDLSRNVSQGHECHMFQVEELRALLRNAGLIDLELTAEGWLTPNNAVDTPEFGTDAWKMLLDAELRASEESPGAGSRIIAWGRVQK